MFLRVVYSDDDDDDEWLLNRVWDNEKNWYKAREIIIREKEAEKWSIKMQDKDKKLSSLNEREINCLSTPLILINFFSFRTGDGKERIINEITRSGSFKETDNGFKRDIYTFTRST